MTSDSEPVVDRELADTDNTNKQVSSKREETVKQSHSDQNLSDAAENGDLRTRKAYLKRDDAIAFPFTVKKLAEVRRDVITQTRKAYNTLSVWGSFHYDFVPSKVGKYLRSKSRLASEGNSLLGFNNYLEIVKFTKSLNAHESHATILERRKIT